MPHIQFHLDLVVFIIIQENAGVKGGMAREMCGRRGKICRGFTHIFAHIREF